MTEGVKTFLQKLGMMKYYNIFSAKGFDLESDIPHLNQSDLEETLMVSCEKERDTILWNAQRFKTSCEHHVYEWLRRHSLDHYFINFLQSGLVNLQAVSVIQLPNEELYDELEIVLPGHQKRLERAVLNLRQEMQRRSVAEKPVTQGWWGKPRCLPQAKFDFLCVEGKLFAAHEPDKRVKIDFMVDSGSDVSTVQEETLESLNLELVGPIYSCGIHGGNHTNLYRAQLQIGQEEITVEVIASNYDSLGSRIVRHFRHVIDGGRHIWLKGNYKDPIPAVLPLKVPLKKAERPDVLSVENKHPPPTDPSSIPCHVPSPHKPTTGHSPSLPPQHPTPCAGSSLNGTSSHLKEDPLLKPDTFHDRNRDQSYSEHSNSTEDNLYNSNKDNLKQPVASISNVVNFVSNNISDGSTSSLKNSSLRSQSPDMMPGARTKRPIEDSDGADLCPSLPKTIKLEHETLSSFTEKDRSMSSRLRCTSDRSEHSSQKSDDPFSRASENTTTSVDDPSVPENPPLHPHLLDTDDDIDHMDSLLFYQRSLLSSVSTMSDHPFGSSLHSSATQQHIPNRSKWDFKNSRLNPTAFADPVGQDVSQGATNHLHVENVPTDVVHINSDDGDNDDNSDDEHGGDGGESRHEMKFYQGLGQNFMPGSNASSVTISMVDLDEFEMNEPDTR